MLIRTGHKPTDWRDEGPSYARLPSHRGELVTGLPGVVARNREDQSEAQGEAGGWEVKPRLRYLWHRLRGHRAFWLEWCGACNTCDVDFPRSRIGRWWS